MSTNPQFLVAVVDRRVQAHVEVWEGLCAEAEALGWDSPIEEAIARDRTLDTQSCAGILSWVRLKNVDENKVPVINLSSGQGPLPGFGNLLNDDREIGRVAARHLLENGYSEYLALDREGLLHFARRAQGFREVLDKENLPVRQEQVPDPGSASRQDGWNPQRYLDAEAELLVPFLKDLPPDTGIFAVDHPVAQLVEHCLTRFFPERVHTTGLVSGDLPVSRRWLPGKRRSISCVRTANDAKGRVAMRWFVEHGRDVDAVGNLCQVFAPLGVHTRASTAGPACSHPVLARGIRWSWLRIQGGVPPTVEEVAAELGMSARTLNRLFQGELETTTRDFLLRLRMERAAQTLRAHPKRNVQQVSNEAGFSNQGAFSSAFRAWSGMTPRAFRADA